MLCAGGLVFFGGGGQGLDPDTIFSQLLIQEHS